MKSMTCMWLSGALGLNPQKCEEYLLMKSREKRVLDEIRVNGEVTEETRDSYKEIYKVSFDTLKIKGVYFFPPVQ